MIVLFGFREKLLKPCYMGIRYCKQCRKFQHFYLMKSVNQFTLFFIPVFWWTKKYYLGCGICQSVKEISKIQYEQYQERYESFVDLEKCTAIYEFCIDMAASQENTQENIEKLFRQVKERFDLNGFDDDFYKMIVNIFSVQEYARKEPKIVEI